jgi:hypothetical protein
MLLFELKFDYTIEISARPDVPVYVEEILQDR